MKTLLNTIVVVVWLALSLAAVSLVGHYRKRHAYGGGGTTRDQYRADRDLALQLIVFFIGVLSVVVIFALNRVAG